MAEQNAPHEAHPLDPNAFATKLDLQLVKNDLQLVKSELEGKIADVQISLTRLEGRMTAWGTVFVALWALTVAILGAILKGVL